MGRRIIGALAAAAIAGLPRWASALDWDTNLAAPGAQGGTGAWSLSSSNRFWYNGSANVAWINGTDARFPGTGPFTVTVDNSAGQISAKSLTFLGTGYAITGGALVLGA